MNFNSFLTLEFFSQPLHLLLVWLVFVLTLTFLFVRPEPRYSWAGRIRYELRLGRARWAERFWFALAMMLPRQLVLWAAIRLIAHGTSGKWGDTVVPEVRAVTVLKRWDEPNE